MTIVLPTSPYYWCYATWQIAEVVVWPFTITTTTTTTSTTAKPIKREERGKVFFLSPATFGGPPIAQKIYLLYV